MQTGVCTESNVQDWLHEENHVRTPVIPKHPVLVHSGFYNEIPQVIYK